MQPGWGTAFSLYMKTLNNTINRAMVTLLVNGVAFVLMIVAFAAAGVGAMFHPIGAAVACMPFIIATIVWFWWTSGWVFRTYVAHIAVLAEFIRHDKVETNGKSLVEHGTAIANEVFSGSDGPFEAQRNFDNVLVTAQVAITAGVAFLPQSVAGFLRSLIWRVRLYLSWTLVSYVMVTRQPGRDPETVHIVMLHAFAQAVQSWKKLIRSLIWNALVEGILLFPVWVFVGLSSFGAWFAIGGTLTAAAMGASGAAAAAGAQASALTGIISLVVALMIGLIFGSMTTYIVVGLNRDLWVRPLCLIRTMLDYHAEVASRPLDRALVAKVSRLEELVEQIEGGVEGAAAVAEGASSAFSMVKGFMGD